MTYLKVFWKHNYEDEPVIFYSELDAELNEVRRVDIFRDGSLFYVCAEISTGDMELSYTAFPPFEEIAADPQFEPIKITKEEFEEIWCKAHNNA
jgi:hypothetical protein